MFEILLQAYEINFTMMKFLQKDAFSWNVFKAGKASRELKKRIVLAKSLIFLMKVREKESQELLDGWNRTSQSAESYANLVKKYLEIMNKNQ